MRFNIEFMCFTSPNTSSTASTKVLDTTLEKLDDRTVKAWESAFQTFVKQHTSWGPNQPFTTWVFLFVWLPEGGAQQPGSASYKLFSKSAADQQKIVDEFKAFVAVTR